MVCDEYVLEIGFGIFLEIGFGIFLEIGFGIRKGFGNWAGFAN